MNEHKNYHKRSRRTFLQNTAKGSLALLSLSSFAAAAHPANPGSDDTEYPAGGAGTVKADHLVRSIPQNMVFGYYGADVPPVARIKNGETAAIQTVNLTGISRKDPEAFFKANQLPVDDHAKDIIDIVKNVQPDPSGLRGHMLTGPVYIEDAEPGDMLEVQILDLELRSGYGVNSVWPKGGGLPDAITKAETFVYRYDKKKKTGSFKEGIEIPLQPFMGVMAVSPPAESGRVSSIPPGFYGGNLDLKHLVKGATLYLPVSVKGALFTTGDCHAAQGNGELSGVAIEASLTLVAKFVVHKDKAIKQVRAETPSHFIAIGLDPDLRQAMKNAAQEACKQIMELGYTFNEAYSIASTGVNFEVTQVVDQTLGVHAMIPKSIFTNRKFPYWKD